MTLTLYNITAWNFLHQSHQLNLFQTQISEPHPASGFCFDDAELGGMWETNFLISSLGDYMMQVSLRPSIHIMHVYKFNVFKNSLSNANDK